MKINEVARLTGVAVRTLHHYDDIGLLVPKKDVLSGYRHYSDKDIDRLQQILFFRACDFPLKKIKVILNNPDFNREKAFSLQKNLLLVELKRIEKIIDNLDRSINNYKRGRKMSNKEKFEGFDFTENPYEEEAKKLWGEDVVKKSQKYLDKKGKEWQNQMGKDFTQIFIDFNKLINEEPNSQDAQKMCERLFNFLNSNFNHTYSLEAFLNLSSMYVEDVRFKKNIDKHGVGTAEFVNKAIKIYVKNQK